MPRKGRWHFEEPLKTLPPFTYFCNDGASASPESSPRSLGSRSPSCRTSQGSKWEVIEKDGHKAGQRDSWRPPGTVVHALYALNVQFTADVQKRARTTGTTLPDILSGISSPHINKPHLVSLVQCGFATSQALLKGHWRPPLTSGSNLCGSSCVLRATNGSWVHAPSALEMCLKRCTFSTP